MQTSAERLENNVVEVSVTVDAKAVDKAIADTYKELAKKYRFPGFRPGKAPRPVIDNNIGKDAVLGQATEALVNEAAPKALHRAPRAHLELLRARRDHASLRGGH